MGGKENEVPHPPTFYLPPLYTVFQFFNYLLKLEHKESSRPKIVDEKYSIIFCKIC